MGLAKNMICLKHSKREKKMLHKVLQKMKNLKGLGGKKDEENNKLDNDLGDTCFV